MRPANPSSNKQAVLSYPDYDYVFKVIVVGDSGVGKSSVLLRFADDVFQDNYISTIGVDMRIRTVDVKGKNVKLNIWDTAGQDRFKTICCQYYRGAHAVIFVYDVTDVESFEHIQTWYNEVTNYCSNECMFLMVGNKSDLPHKRVVSFDQAQAYADQLGIPYIETSAKNNTNVTHTFLSTATKLTDQFGHTQQQPGGKDVIQVRPGSMRSVDGVKRSKLGPLNCFDCSIM